MIDLFLIKLNGEYDDIGATPNIQNGLFLCDTDGESYTRGYSYQITDGNAQRVDSIKDYKIKQAIYPTIQSVCEWLNNWFTRPNKYYYSCMFSTFNEIERLISGDLVQVKNSRGLFVSYVMIDGDIITYENSAIQPLMIEFVKRMNIPQDFELAISQMIYYDVFNRETADGLQSENIGNYSYSKEETTVGSLAYPAELVSGIETNYKKIRFVQ